MSTVEQADGSELSEVSPFTERRRKELVRELKPELEQRAVGQLRALVESPSELWMASEYRHSRGRNHARHCILYALYELLADRAASDEQAIEKLLGLRAEIDTVVKLLLDRVVGLGDTPDLQRALELDSREGAEANVATIEALADEELTAEEARRIEQKERDEIAASRAKIRALNYLRTSGQLPDGEAA